MSERSLPLEHRPFLQNRINYYITLAVIATTVFSIFNINSICIMLLVLCRLVDGGPVKAVRTAFTNKYFLAYFSLFLVEALGLLYTHNTQAGGHIVEKDATLVAISFTICAGKFTDDKGYRELMKAYCLILFVASLWCLGAAAGKYMDRNDISVFFYHPFSHAIHENAIYFSLFMIYGLLFLLTPASGIGNKHITLRAKKWLRIGMIVFFIGIIVLLASKLLLVILVLILIHFSMQKYLISRNVLAISIVGLAGILVMVWVLYTNNPIRERYLDIAQGDVSMIDKEKFSKGTYFNGIQLRLLEWRFAYEILNENNGWLLGVSPGDSQDLLDQKYVHAGMNKGNYEQNKTGYLGYNFHDQYLENFVHSGPAGLGALLLTCGLLIGVVRRWKTREAFFTVAILLTLFVVESFITLQHGVFLFSFFPLLLLYSPKKAPGKAKE